ncbi:hypothetical protein GVAV_003350 [Gurleya vavrai]
MNSNIILLLICIFTSELSSNDNKILKNIVTKSTGVIIGKYDCPYCDKAIDLLKSNYVEFTYIPAERHYSLKKVIEKKYNHFTVPVIFLHSEFVGGFQELNEILINDQGYESYSY